MHKIKIIFLILLAFLFAATSLDALPTKSYTSKYILDKDSYATFAQNDIAGLVAWYRADAGIHLNGNSHVDQWNDQSSSGNNLNIISSVAIDVFSNIQNGLPAVYFSAANSNFIDCNTINIPQPFTVFSVIQQKTMNGATSVYDNPGGAGSETVLQNSDNNGVWKLYAGSALNSSESVTLNITVLITAIFNGSSSLIQKNNNTASYGNVGANGLVHLRVGNSYYNTNYWNGYVMEILIFNSALSTQNRTIVQNYLNNKWAIW